MTKPFLCVPSQGEPIGADLCRTIQSYGWRGIRIDYPEDHSKARAMLEDVRNVPELQVILLLAGGKMTRSDGKPWDANAIADHVRDCCTKMFDLGLFDMEHPPWLEVGNEPDLAHKRWSDHPDRMAAAFHAAYWEAQSFGRRMTVLTPAVSNLNKRGIEYLGEMFASTVPSGAHLAFHRYPHRGVPTLKHDGFKSRDDEVETALRIANKSMGRGSRSFHVTEVGYSNFEYGGQWKPDAYVADVLESEYRYWSRLGADSMSWFQINTAPVGANDSDHVRKEKSFGVRDHLGNWKPELAACSRTIGGVT